MIELRSNVDMFELKFHVAMMLRFYVVKFS